MVWILNQELGMVRQIVLLEYAVVNSIIRYMILKLSYLIIIILITGCVCERSHVVDLKQTSGEVDSATRVMEFLLPDGTNTVFDCQEIPTTTLVNLAKNNNVTKVSLHLLIKVEINNPNGDSATYEKHLNRAVTFNVEEGMSRWLNLCVTAKYNRPLQPDLDYEIKVDGRKASGPDLDGIPK